MAKQKNKVAGENEALVIVAKESLRHYPEAESCYVLENGIPFLKSEEATAMEQAKKQGKQLFEYNLKTDLLTEIKEA